MRMLVAGVVAGAAGMLALQALVILALSSPAIQSYDPIILNPDNDLSKNGISMAMFCGAKPGLMPGGRGSGVLDKVPPNGDTGAWTRGKTVRDDCSIFYHHKPSYNPGAYETCWIGCDHDALERRLR